MTIRTIGKRQSAPANKPAIDVHDLLIAPAALKGSLRVPQPARSIVVFAHGSGSNRFSPRNKTVAEALNAQGMATLLVDLLTAREAFDQASTFNIPLLASRLVEAICWISLHKAVRGLPLGLFGASTGAAAALSAAAELGNRVGAVVSRGGRPDLAEAALEHVRAPTLLIVGGADTAVLDLNRQALFRLSGPKALQIIPGAAHLFSEAGALEAVARHAVAWFDRYLGDVCVRITNAEPQ